MPGKLCVIPLLLMTSLVLLSQQYRPNPMPAELGFPATTDQMRAAKDDPEALRAHGWNLFRIVWENVAQSGFKPRWYTWCTDAEMFTPATSVDCTGAGAARDLKDEGRMQDLQFRFGNDPDAQLPLLPNVLSQVYISPALAKYISTLPASIRPPVQIPDRATYSDMAPGFFRVLLDRKVTELPSGASDEVAVKVAWAEVPCPNSPNSPAPSLPAWDGSLPTGSGMHLTPTAFPKFYIDPKSLARKGCTPDPNVKVPSGQMAHTRDDFFWFQQISNDWITGIPNVNPLRQGDYLMLTGMHIITREQADWVWATYWLSTNSDRRQSEGKPANVQKGKGANFAMEISLDDQRPIFNPFLEGEQEGFEHANCMRCHRAASVFRSSVNGKLICAVPKNDSPPDTHSTPLSVRTDFLWTLARRATANCDGSN